MLRRALSIATCLVLAIAAGAQPYSQSLIQCATLLETANRQFPHRAELPEGRALTEVGEVFRAAAAAQAREEGRDEPTRYLSLWEGQAIVEWDSRAATFLFSSEFRDWTGYCAALAGHLDVEIDEMPGGI